MRILITLLVGLVFSTSSFALRSEIDRFKTIHDKVSTEELYHPLEHKWFLDIHGRESKHLREVIKDGKDVSSRSAAEINTFLQQHLDSEHFGQVKIQAGIPLPKFKLFGAKFKTDLRGVLDAGASLSITTLPDPIMIGATPIAPNTPFIQLYIKKDEKYGANFNVKYKKNWDFDGFVYYMYRWDRHEALTATEIALERKAVNLKKPRNSTVTANGDFALKYDYGDSTFRFSVEEVKFAKLDDKESTNGKLYYGGGVPKYRFHVERKINLSIVKLKPFVGIHKRSGYVYGKGIYAGLDARFDFPLSGTFYIDGEYATLNPRLEWWIFLLEYSARVAIKRRTDGNALTADIHALNLRFSY